ncbi:BsuBI/PstI family type II restriction endonuclease [Pseudomonas sp. A-B-19]|uniref:BsuBI/PstI family type II restriction endonuclease n=1 Tax=Pseudomonas sp. A-B-19 TaxID=2832405 RepID=UPI001CBC2DE5|nr:BsuBI/PstI family type II restriction endonuclease [Pseudomonas sp. A-B-19]
MSKIDEAINIIAALGYPRAQQNERSALTLLALIQLQESGSWQILKEPMLGVRAILDFCRNSYLKPYAENSRESFRKETLHQFVSGGLVLQNPDEPARAPNSPKWCYQISPEAKQLLMKYKTAHWDESLQKYLAGVGSLAEKYKAARDLALVPCVLPDGSGLQMSPGGHSELIRDIIQEFAPRFAPAAKVLYVGDTGNKGVIHDESFLAKLGVNVHERGKMPDVILYLEEKKWLFLVESVTSVGPVDGKRHAELSYLFRDSTVGLVYVTAFPSRQLMARFLPDIAWETEVWCSDNPTHLIHFNGDRFLGPHVSER